MRGLLGFMTQPMAQVAMLVCVCVLRGEGVTFIVTYTCYPSALTGIHAMQSQKGSNVGG